MDYAGKLQVFVTNIVAHLFQSLCWVTRQLPILLFPLTASSMTYTQPSSAPGFVIGKRWYIRARNEFNPLLKGEVIA